MNRKVTVVGGAGNVGATVARAVAHKELADVVIIDIADDEGGRHRARHLPVVPGRRLVGPRASASAPPTTASRHSANSDVVVITSGVPRKPGMSRDDLLAVNYKIMQAVTAQIVKHSPNCIIVPVANPLDAMSQAVYRLSGFPRERVIGMAGVLDSARMRTFVAMELGVSVNGRHTASCSAATATRWCRCRGCSTVAGIPLTELVAMGKLSTGEARRDLHPHRQRRRRDREAGRHERLVRARRVGRVAMVEAILKDQKKHHAVLGVPAGRVRHQRPLRRRAGEARRWRRREDHRDRTSTDAEKAALHEVRRAPSKEARSTSSRCEAAMKIHEYQGKGAPRAATACRCRAAKSRSPPQDAVEIAKRLGGAGRRRQGADPRRRPRQGRRRQGRQGRRGRSRPSPRAILGMHAGHPPDRARPASVSAACSSRRACAIDARALPRPAARSRRPAHRRSWPAPRAAWTSRRWRPKTPGEDLQGVDRSRRSGLQPFQARSSAFALGLTGDQREEGRQADAGALPGVPRRPTPRCSRSTRWSSPRAATCWRSTPR